MLDWSKGASLQLDLEGKGAGGRRATGGGGRREEEAGGRRATGERGRGGGGEVVRRLEAELELAAVGRSPERTRSRTPGTISICHGLLLSLSLSLWRALSFPPLPDASRARANFSCRWLLFPRARAHRVEGVRFLVWQ